MVNILMNSIQKLSIVYREGVNVIVALDHVVISVLSDGRERESAVWYAFPWLNAHDVFWWINLAITARKFCLLDRYPGSAKQPHWSQHMYK